MMEGKNKEIYFIIGVFIVLIIVVLGIIIKDSKLNSDDKKENDSSKDNVVDKMEDDNESNENKDEFEIIEDYGVTEINGKKIINNINDFPEENDSSVKFEFLFSLYNLRDDIAEYDAFINSKQSFENVVVEKNGIKYSISGNWNEDDALVGKEWWSIQFKFEGYETVFDSNSMYNCSCYPYIIMTEDYIVEDSQCCDSSGMLNIFNKKGDKVFSSGRFFPNIKPIVVDNVVYYAEENPTADGAYTNGYFFNAFDLSSLTKKEIQKFKATEYGGQY